MTITVGQFNDSYPPVIDGVSNTVKNYAYWLNKNNANCVVVTPSFPKHIDQDDFKIIRYRSVHLPMRPPYRLGIPKFDLRVKKDLMNIHFDLLHVHSPFSSGQLALKLARKRHIPIVATFHSKFYDDFKQALKSDLLAKMMVKHVIAFYNKVDYVWTVNESTANTLREYGYTGHIEIMPNGCDFDSNMNFINNELYMNKTFHIQENIPVFLFVGQHIWQKNIKLIVEALKCVKDQGQAFKMFFIGEGYAKKALMKYVHDLGLTHEISFMGKITDRNLLKRFYARSDLFLFPSVYDNAPLVVREAAALKTPSLVIEGSNAQDGITNNINGFTCHEDAFDIAHRLIELIKQPLLLKEVGENASQTISQTWESIVDTVSLKYREIITKYQEEQKKIISVKF